MAKIGTRKKIYKTKTTMQDEEGLEMMAQLIQWLALFVRITLAKRFVTMVLTAAGIPAPRIMELVNASDRMVYGVRKEMKTTMNASAVLSKKQGSIQPTKTASVEDEIIAEIKAHPYHDLQQIADMIKAKFSISISRWSVGRLLKKRGLRN